jgi:hypothetical protein
MFQSVNCNSSHTSRRRGPKTANHWCSKPTLDTKELLEYIEILQENYTRSEPRASESDGSQQISFKTGRHVCALSLKSTEDQLCVLMMIDDYGNMGLPASACIQLLHLHLHLGSAGAVLPCSLQSQLAPVRILLFCGQFSAADSETS